MKTPGIVLACGGVLLLAVIAVGYTFHARALQKEWPVTQLKSAVTLGEALSTHRQTHGSYPERLTDLVDRGVMPTDEFERLRFRSSPGADADDWLYQPPGGLEDIAIVAPVWIHPWKGHSGLRATARADGSGELISRMKDHRAPRWAAE